MNKRTLFHQWRAVAGRTVHRVAIGATALAAGVAMVGLGGLGGRAWAAAAGTSGAGAGNTSGSTAGNTSVGGPATRRPLDHETLWTMKQVGNPAVSPDGRWLVVPVTEPAYDEKEERADLWILPADGSEPARRLTSAKGRESGPAWSPDSRQLAFSAKREGDDVSQVYVIDVGGGEARRVTKSLLGARAPRWSPDGRLLLFQAGAHRGATNEASHRALVEERKAAKSKVRIYDGFPVRRWDRWLDDVQTRVWVVPADGLGVERDLLAGAALVGMPGFRGASGEAGGEDLEAVWAPDGRSILFTATTNGHVAARGPVFHHLFEVSLGGGEPRALSMGDISLGGPAFSPDGRTLVFTTLAEAGELYAVTRLAAVTWPWAGGMEGVRELAIGLDRSVSEFAIAGDSASVMIAAGDSGRGRVWTASLTGGAARPALAVPDGVWQGLSLGVGPGAGAGGVWHGRWEAAHRPGEIFRVEAGRGGGVPAVRRLTSFNVDVAARVDWEPLREFWFTNRAGRAIHNYVALPPGFDPARKYPLFVVIHGGHASMWADAVIRRWNYHLLAAPGYVVLLTDYTGSTGYGEAFTRAIRGDPLRGPADDINAAADEAIRRFPWVDGTRQAAGGASYGGHLANWLEGTTTRYRCLVSHAGLASLYAQWATSDAIHHREVMMGGPFWEKAEAWLEQSPATYAAKFRTPMLLSIGESDYRVPLNNVLEMWSVLQRQQVPSRLLVWPDENHWVMKGENSRVFYREVHQWLERWLLPVTPVER